MRIFHRQLIYVQVRLNHFTARVVSGDRTIRGETGQFSGCARWSLSIIQSIKL